MLQLAELWEIHLPDLSRRSRLNTIEPSGLASGSLDSSFSHRGAADRSVLDREFAADPTCFHLSAMLGFVTGKHLFG